MNGLEKSLKEAEELVSAADTLISNVEKEFQEKNEDICSNFDRFGKAIDKQHEDAADKSIGIIYTWELHLNKALRKLNKIAKMENFLLNQVRNEGSENEKEIFAEIFTKLNLKEINVYELKSSMYLLRASWNKAIKFAKMGLEKDSDNFLFYYYIGVALMNKGQGKNAIGQFQKAINFANDDEFKQGIQDLIDEIKAGKGVKKGFVGSFKVLLILVGLAILCIIGGSWEFFNLFLVITGIYFFLKWK